MSAFRKALFGVNCVATAKNKVGDGETETVKVTGILSSDKDEFVASVKANNATLSLSIKDGDNRSRTYSNREPNVSEAVAAAREVLGLPAAAPKRSDKPQAVNA